MALDNVPAGDIAVFAICELYSLPFSFDGVDRLRAGDSWGNVLRSWGIALALMLLGLLFPWLRKRLGERISGLLERFVHTKRFWLVGLSVCLVAIITFELHGYYHANLTIPSNPPVKKWAALPPAFAFEKTKVAVVPKPVPPPIPWYEIQKGLAEPPGAPNAGGGDDKWLKEEERLNSMSLTQIRDYLAENIAHLKKFNGEWTYGASESLDGPPAGKILTREEMKFYNDQLARKNELEQEIRPKKRFTDFQKQFPNLPVLIEYLRERSPDVPVPDECSPSQKMYDFAALTCANYLQQLLDKKYPRPQ